MATTANKTKTNKTEVSEELTVTDSLTVPSVAALSGAEGVAALTDYFGDDPKYRGVMTDFPTAIVINGERTTFGFFLKEAELEKAEWDKGLTHNGENYTHVFRDGTKEKGLLFKSPYLHVIAQSPRFLEVKRNNINKDLYPELGKSGSIVGVYDPDGRIDQTSVALYEKLKLDKLVTLRTLYLVKFVNEDCRHLHHVPFCISIHGSFAVDMGKAIERMRCSIVSNRALSMEAFSLIAWNPTFASDLIGVGDNKSWCTVVAKDENGKLVQSFKVPSNLKEIEEEFDAIRQSNEGFAWRYFSSGEYHPIVKTLVEGTNPTSLLESGKDEYDLPPTEIPY